jgi:hypothetical protein
MSPEWLLGAVREADPVTGHEVFPLGFAALDGIRCGVNDGNGLSGRAVRAEPCACDGAASRKADTYSAAATGEISKPKEAGLSKNTGHAISV